MLKKGLHETRNGLKATVAQLRCYGGAAWVFGGAITFPDGKTYFHHWNIHGASLTGDARLDIPVAPFSSRPAPKADPSAKIIPFPVRAQSQQIMVG